MRARLDAIAGQPIDRETQARTARPQRSSAIRAAGARPSNLLLRATMLSLRAECSKNGLSGVALLRLRAVFLRSRSRVGLPALVTDITRTASLRATRRRSPARSGAHPYPEAGGAAVWPRYGYSERRRSEQIGPARLEQVLQLVGEREVHVLVHRLEFFDLPDPELLARVIHDLTHEDLRRRGARRQAQDTDPLQPLGPDVRGPLDQVGRHIVREADLAQPERVRAVGRPEHQERVHVGRHGSDRVLAVLRGVADVPLRGAGHVGKTALQDLDDLARVVEGERGLCQVRDLVRVGDLDRLGLFLAADETNGAGRLSERADRLVMVLVPDQDDRVALPGVVDRFQVDLGHQRAGRVDRAQALLPGRFPHGRGDAVRRVDEPGPVGHFIGLLDEHGALGAQLVHDVAVVDDLLAHVDGSVAHLEGAVHDVDRAHDARAESAQARDEELLDGRLWGCPWCHHVTVSTSFSSRLRAAAGSAPSLAGRERSGKSSSAFATTPGASSFRFARCNACGLCSTNWSGMPWTLSLSAGRPAA